MARQRGYKTTGWCREGMGETVLVVEDSQALWQVLQTSLRTAGFDPDTVVDDTEGMERVAKDPPVRLVSDVTSEQIVRSPARRRRRAPFIVIAGQGDESVVAGMKKLGARDYPTGDTTFLDRLPLEVRSNAEKLAMEKRLREAEEALRESEERYRLLAENVADIVIVTDMGLKPTYVSPSVARLTGYSVEEAMTLSLPDVLTPASFEVTLGHFAERRLAEQMEPEDLSRSRAVELEVRRRDGSTAWFELRANFLRDSGGQAVGVLGVARDITGRRQAEETLLQSREELRNLAEHIRSAREEERTSIARDIHDELGQLLVALKMDLVRLTTEFTAGHRQLAARTEAMTGLADEAIRAVKETSTRLRPGVLDDLGIAAALEWQAGEFHKRTGIRCRVSMEPEDTAIGRDVATAVFRIFQEALTNILRHASATGVAASLSREGDSLVLRVRDNGIGITSEQIASSTSLGLIGMRERAYFIGGELDIRPARNGGTV